MKLSLLFAIAPLTVTACPGSASAIHAKCEMGVQFSNSCDEVRAEIVGRIQSPTWTDPHNGGTYSLVSSNASYVSGTRLTGDKKYTDKFDFIFSASGTSCKVEACSESQVFSMIDYSTNYCNLHDLYCSSTDGCPTVGKELSYTETYSSCSQHDDVCVVKGLRSTTECAADLQKATLDLTQLKSAISKAAVDCDGTYTYACQEDQDEIILILNKASADLTKAAADCGGADCTNAVNIVNADIPLVIDDMAQLAFDCGSNPTRCNEDVMALANDLVKTGNDITKALTACSS
jgi:hypothetical protein